MSSHSSPVLTIELQRTWLRALPGSTLLLSALFVFWLVHWEFRSAMMMVWLATIAAGVAWWQTGVGRAASMRRLTWQQNQQWLLQDAAGAVHYARLSLRSWWTPWVMCLKFRRPHQQRTVLIWRNELTAQLWHQWQARLCLEGRSAAGDAPPAAAELN